MAYKFQLGGFQASGSITIADTLDAEAGAVKGSVVTGSTLFITASNSSTCAMTVGDLIDLQDVSSSQGLVMKESNAMRFQAHEDAAGAQKGAKMAFGFSNKPSMVVFKKTADSPALFGLEMSDGSSNTFKANYTAAEGKVSGSGAFTFGGNVTLSTAAGPTLELVTNANTANSSLHLSEGTAGSTTNGGAVIYSGANNKLSICCGTTLTT